MANSAEHDDWALKLEIAVSRAVGRTAKIAAADAWLAEVREIGPGCGQVWLLLYQGACARIEQSCAANIVNHFGEGDVSIMYNDNSTTVGRDNFGQAGGSGNTFTARDISSFNQAVDNSSNVSKELQIALKNARMEIDSLDLGDAKSLALQNLEGLATELNKPKPNPTMLEALWSGVKWLGSKAKSILEIGKLLSPWIGGPPAG